MTAWGPTFDEALPAHGPGAARVPHPRRQDQHPVPRKRDRAPRVSARARRRPRSSTRRRSCSSSSRGATGRRSCSTILGDVIVNGNPRGRRDRPTSRCLRPVPIAAAHDRAGAAGARGSCCWNWAPKEFAEWTREQKRLLITDTTLRDAHQSLLATRVRTYDMLAVAERVRAPAAASCSAWRCGAARRSTPRCGSCTKTRGSGCGSCAQRIPNICFQMLLRGIQRGGVHELSGQRRARVRADGGG